MSETIYTIPVNEAFEACAADHSLGCPFCRLYNILEGNEIDLILGASMMEPDTRIKTNEQSFCPTHFDRLLEAKKRLPLALMMESHMESLREDIKDGTLSSLIGRIGVAAPKRLARLDDSCYICSRIEYNFSRMLSNAALLYTEDETFKEKIKKQPYICLPHFRMWLEVAQREMKKEYPNFYRDVSKPVYDYYDTLKDDISWFCKKFDYRYENESWGNSKDSLERARKFLCADLHKAVK